MSAPKSSRAVVAVDAMGGDLAPDETVAGAVAVAREDPQLSIVLVGDPERVSALGCELPANVTLEVAHRAITMSDHPAKAVREKTDASVVVSAQLVRDGRAGAMVSAGNTGATMAAALLYLGRIEGIARPAIAVVVPTPAGPVVLVDAGANADCKPEYLVQFALMGSDYAACVLGIDTPKIGLLNIGEEESKGTQLYQAAHRLMRQVTSINFVGNIEGRDLFTGSAHVAVADGFVGNMVLKVMEGLSEMLFAELKRAVTASAGAQLGGILLRPQLARLKAEVDYEEYGGAQLLGVNGGCIIAHGASRAKAIANAVRVAAQVVRKDVVDAIATHVR